MISLKELRYVDQKANKIPMPGMEYSLKVLDEIEKCYELYNEKYKDKEYNIIFSNSEEISLEIFDKNLCHLVGIDFSGISGDYYDDYRKQAFGTIATDISSYELLELIIGNKEKVAELDNDTNNKIKAINYYKSAIKCSIFHKISDFEKFNFAAINYRGVHGNIDAESQKLLFMPSDDAVAPYFMLGIKKSDSDYNPGKFIAYSSLALNDYVNFFNNQEVIIPIQILISNKSKLSKIVATPEEKLQLIRMYLNIINKHNLENKLNIFSDYTSMLTDLNNKQLIKKKTN